MNLLEGKSLYHSVQICQLSKMVRLIGMKADPLRHQNNETIFIPIGAGLMWDYNTDDLDLTLISFMVLCTILLAVLLKVCVRMISSMFAPCSFQANFMKWLTHYVPESGVLLLVGLIVSHVAWGLDEANMVLGGGHFSFIHQHHIE